MTAKFTRSALSRVAGALMVFALATPLALASPVPAQKELFVYPNAGQDKTQQDRDRYECHAWAVDQTGFDPSRAGLSVPVPVAPTQKRSALGGTVGGAALGAAVGAITGSDIGKSALIGGGAGLVGSGLRNRRASKKAGKAYEADLAASQHQLSASIAQYDRALGACLEGRNYTVK